MLFQAIQDIIYNTISDDETNQHYITPAQIAAYGNKALQEIVERTEHYESTSGSTIPADTATAAVSNVSRFKRVEVDYEAMRPVTQSELRKYGYDWRARTGKPRFYYTDELRTDSDVTTIGLYPATSASYNLLVTIIRTPAAVSLTSHMNLPEWCSEAVAWSILSDVYATDTEIMNLEASSFYRAIFDEAVIRIRIRSFDRLPKAWSYQSGPPDGSDTSLWNNFPEEIPAP